MIKFKHKGNFNNTEKFFSRSLLSDHLHTFHKYGKIGVDVLASATPVDSGKTANSWDYTINETRKGIKLTWTNSNVTEGVPIAVLLQYGHGTRNGGYIQGRDFINPAIRPIFDAISNDIWREVTQ